MKSILPLTCAILAASSSVASAAALAGAWEFNDGANLTQSSGGGATLAFAGETPAWSASAADEGGASLSGVITTVSGPANHLIVTHGIGPNGGPGAAFVNEYSILVDILSPPGSRNDWRAIMQTAPDNGNDGDYFINPENLLGVAALSYSDTSINDALWARVVVTFDLDPDPANSVVRTYLNGELLFTHNSPQPFDGRHSLDPQTVLFFADEDNENAPLLVGAVAIWNGALTEGEVRALGGPGGAIPEPSAAGLSLFAAAGLLARRRKA